MMSGKPAFSIHFDHEAETFNTPQWAGQPATTTGDLLSTLADWKGERSRRGPGEGEPNGVRRTSEDDRRESSGKSTAGATGRSDEERSEPRGRPAGGRGTSERQRREPRTHESARASEVLSARESTSGTEQSTASQPIFHQ